jgi:peptidoglycan hydrolase CwlO-like protein
MRHHTQRIRRIQALCAQLDHTIQDAHVVQETVEQLKAESGRLLQDLREPHAREVKRAATSRARQRTPQAEGGRERRRKGDA